MYLDKAFLLCRDDCEGGIANQDDVASGLATRVIS